MSKAQHKLKLIVLPAVLTTAITANYYSFYTIFLTIILQHNIGAKRQMFCFHAPSFTKQKGEFGEKVDVLGPSDGILSPLSSTLLSPTPSTKVYSECVSISRWADVRDLSKYCCLHLDSELL